MNRKKYKFPKKYIYEELSLKDRILALSIKYVECAKEFLIDEYDSYEGRTTGMDVEEYSRDKKYRAYLQDKILENESVTNCWWEEESYGYTPWIEF